MNKVKGIIALLSILYFLVMLSFLNGSVQRMLTFQKHMQYDLNKMAHLTKQFAGDTTTLNQIPKKLSSMEATSQQLVQSLSKANSLLDDAIALQFTGLRRLQHLDQEIIKLNQNLTPLPLSFQTVARNLEKTGKTSTQTNTHLQTLLKHLTEVNTLLSDIDRSIP